MALFLAGCSSTPDWANPVEWYQGVAGWFGDEDPETEAARARAKAKQQKTPPGPYPNLSTVPARPKDISDTSQANRVQKGLVADRSQARYTELELTKASPPPPPSQPAVTPAPTAPVQAAPPPRTAEPAKPAESAPPPLVPPAAGTPPVPPGPPPKADMPGPDTAAGAGEKSRNSGPMSRAPGAGAPSGAAAPPPTDMAAVPPATGRAPAVPGTQVGTVLFANNSSKVSDSYDKLLKNIVNLSKERGGALRVVGHASRGDEGADPLKQRLANFRVSLARANSVARELVRLGVPAGKVTVEGRADSDPLYRADAPGGEAGNRRAEIYIDYPKGRR